LLDDVLSSDQEDPGTQAARRIDWQAFMAGLSARDQAIIQFLIEGTGGSAIARKLRVCPSTIQLRKRSLAKAIIEFMGDDILIEVRRLPRWKDSINASRERLACKHERNH
jgi:FixJ family two-component response regulator